MSTTFDKAQENEQQNENLDSGTRTEEEENVTSIYKNINFLKKIFDQSKKEGAEYLIVLGKNFADYYKGEERKVGEDTLLEILSKYKPEEILAIIHTHPKGPAEPSINDLLMARNVLVNNKNTIHGILAENDDGKLQLIMYNYWTIDGSRLAKMLSRFLDNGVKPTREEKLKVANAYVTNIEDFDASKIPEIADHFALWRYYWLIDTSDLFVFGPENIDIYKKLKEKALFIPTGRDEGWLVLGVDASGAEPIVYKVKECKDKVTLKSTRHEFSPIIVEWCKEKPMCRVA